ncbi:MAG: hypothetical protein WB608_21130 [Terracidiphilus sp.]
MKPFVQTALLVYSATLSTVFAVAMVTGAKSQRNAEFDQIETHRLNIVEPDGTLRMVISDHDQMPGVIVRGKEFSKADRPQAGMLFYNDEGTEDGGLIFGGRRNEKGEIVDSGVSLSFDKYGQPGQIVQLAGVDDKENKFAGLAINDQTHRIWVGRRADNASVVSLMDASGKKRIVMQVAADGTPTLDFLDAEGHVVRHVAAGN